MSADVLPVLQQLRAQVKRGGVELMTAFRCFDHLRTGRVDLNRFRAVLDNQRLISLSDSQLLAIHKEYRSKADPTKIDYNSFVIDVEDIPSFDERNLQPRELPSELAHTKPPQLSATAALASPPPTIQKMTDITLDRIRSAIARARLDPESALRAHDKFHNGTCPIPKFASALSSIGIVLTQQDIEGLTTRYRVSDSNVSYIAFLDDLRNDSASRTDFYSSEATGLTSIARPTAATMFSTLSTSAAPTGPIYIDTSIETVLRKVHYITKTLRIQFDVAHNEFRTFDRLAKGVVDEATFKRVLTGAYRVDNLTPREVETLIAQYAVADPSYVSSESTYSLATQMARTQGALTSLPGNLRFVDYKAFIADVNVGQMGGDVSNIEKEPTRVIESSAVGRPWIPEEENEVKVSYSSAKASDGKSLDASLLQGLLERLAEVTDSQRLDLESPFKDRDSLRSGCVNPRQFRTVLASVPLAIPFNEDEWAIILASYQRGSVGIGYRGFLADLATCESATREAKIYAAAVAEESELQRAQEKFNSTSKSYLPKVGSAGANLVASLNASSAEVFAGAKDGKMGSKLSQAELADLANAVISRISSEISRRRLTLRDALRVHDTANHGLIAPSRFNSVLSREGLVKSIDDMAALTVRYGIKNVDNASTLGIKYVEFLEDIGERF